MTTRENLVNALKLRGESRADDLAKPLGLTPMAVRQHLYQLQEEGAVTSVTRNSGRGRPAKLWVLTPKADVFFPDTHRDLSLDLIDSVKSVLGGDALDALIEHRSQKQLDVYISATKSAKKLSEKLDLLANVRSQEGYMAEASKKPNGDYSFVENHCPICEAAKACSGLCAKELDIFKEVLGKTTKIVRDEHIVKGARRCSYTVTKNS